LPFWSFVLFVIAPSYPHSTGSEVSAKTGQSHVPPSSVTFRSFRSIRSIKLFPLDVATQPPLGRAGRGCNCRSGRQ
jgi:hypothetical protein